MSRTQLIKRYENMMYKYGEYDIWDDDIEPKLPNMTTEQIKRDYEADREFYAERAAAGGYF